MRKPLFIFTFIALYLLAGCNSSNREILYSSDSNDQCITLGNLEDWGVEIISHKFENGIGIIKFSGKIEKIPEKAFSY